jgi:H+/Cl- antiporter ClcA
VFDYSKTDLAIFAITWYIFTIFTYGVWIPAGLFLPGIIMGGSIGRLYSRVLQDAFNYTDFYSQLISTYFNLFLFVAIY